MLLGTGAAFAWWQSRPPPPKFVPAPAVVTVVPATDAEADRLATRLAEKPETQLTAFTQLLARWQVGAEFRDRFLAADPATAARFAPGAVAGKWMFDLPAFVAGRIAAAGIAAADVAGRDTCAEAEGFFSYRRAVHRGERDYGRGLSAVALEA